MRLACLAALLLLCPAPAGAVAVSPAAEIQWFDAPVDALGPILAQKPRVIAFGEYHQLRKTTSVRSSLRRFVDEMLPHLLYWPTDLVVETWVTEGACGEQERAVTKDVRRTTQRPKKTEDEIVTLLRRAGEIGIQPHILQVPCADYQALLDPGGEVDYDRLLVLLTRQLQRKVSEVRQRRGDSGRPVLVYGGAVHNDLYPKEEMKRYTFGPQLSRDLGGRYLEVDLYVPEYVEKDTDVTGEPWYELYKKGLQPGKTALIKRAWRSYVVMFPRSR